MKAIRTAAVEPRTKSAAWWQTIATTVMGMVFFLGFISTMEGKKPPPAEPPPVSEGGVLYYLAREADWVPDGVVYERDMDAGTTRALFDASWSDLGFKYEPSEFDHTGRWFAYTHELPNETPYPSLPGKDSDRPRHEIFAVDEFGYAVRLTFDLSTEPDIGWGFYDHVRWVDGDTKIWYSARKLDLATGEIIAGSIGIYEVEIDFSSGTPVATTVPTLVPGSDALGSHLAYEEWGPYLDTMSFDVSTDGSTVYSADHNGGLNSLDLASGTLTLLSDNFVSAHYHPGLDAIIGHNLEGEIARINADGTGFEVLAIELYIRNRIIAGDCTFPVWSPTGDNISFAFYRSARKSSYQEVNTASAEDGSGMTAVSDQVGLAFPLGWFPQP